MPLHETLTDRPAYRVNCCREGDGYVLSYGRGRRRIEVRVDRDPHHQGKFCVPHPVDGFPAIGNMALAAIKAHFWSWASRRYVSRTVEPCGIVAADDERSRPAGIVVGDNQLRSCHRCVNELTVQAWARGRRLCDWCELPCDGLCCEQAGVTRAAMREPCPRGCSCHRGERRKP